MRLLIAAIGTALALLPTVASAQALTLRYRHFVFPIGEKTVQSWNDNVETWQWQGMAVRAPQQLRVDGDSVPALPAGMLKTVTQRPSVERIAQTLRQDIAPRLDRARGSVVIKSTGTGSITFDGVGLPGRTLLTAASADLIARALEEGITDIVLLAEEPPPTVTVQDPALAALGIKTVVAVGESDFTGSTQNRIHNIKTGLAKFNGTLIHKDTVFSFVKVLGPVNAATGYRKELTILGDKTLPDYGGGLCQVSTTAYRGVWEAGFPIVQRRNHSYTVGYYSPQGTDATIYPPHTDIKFQNDSPGALVMQTHIEGTRAYFITYGTPQPRTATIVGPFTWGRTSPPAPKTEYTTDLPAGERKKVGDAVPGMKAAWYRFVQTGTGTHMETVLSHYEARPLFYQIGGADPAAASGSLLPSELLIDPAS